MNTTNKTAVEEIEDKVFTAYNHAGQSTVRAVRLNDVKQALTQAHQQGEREERERCIKVLTDQGFISEKGIQKKIDMKHGSCCCCTDCGHWHDECICESNDLIKALTEVNND